MGLKRDSSSVLSKLKDLGSGAIVTTTACKIQVPVRFMSIGLGQIGIETFSLGNFPIIMEDGTYAVMNLLTMVELSPYKTLTVEIDDVSYYEFHFNPGDVVIKNKTIVKNEDMIFNVFDEYIFKGKVPWYVEYDDIPKMFNLAKKYTGSTAGNSYETIEFIVSLIARHKNDRSKYIRTGITSYKQVSREDLVFVPLASVLNSVKSTVNRLAGSYFSDGVTSSLISPSENISKIESILRK